MEELFDATVRNFVTHVVFAPVTELNFCGLAGGEI